MEKLKLPVIKTELFHEAPDCENPAGSVNAADTDSGSGVVGMNNLAVTCIHGVVSGIIHNISGFASARQTPLPML